MTKPVKFTFDNAFDSPSAAVAAEPVVESFTLEDLEAARDEARALGYAAGMNEAQGHIEATVAATLDSLEAGLSQLMARQTGMLIEIRAEAAELAYVIASKLAPALMDKAPLTEIENLVASCLGEIGEEPRVVVRLPDALVDPLKERIDRVAAATGFAGQIVLLGDETLEGSDARIEWAHGGAERNTRAMAAAIEAAVARYVSAKRSD